MVPLKVLGIDQITKKVLIQAIITLFLFGISTNSLFELWKLLPTIFLPGYEDLDWGNIFLYLIPFFIFAGWIFSLYLIYKTKSDLLAVNAGKTEVVPHRGIVLALSDPKKPPEEFCNLISNTSEDQISSLYTMQSIGQLFKALYHHRKKLRHVWLIRTPVSDPYSVCIQIFLKKFVNKARINTDFNCVIGTNSDAEVIDQTKDILSKIYSKENLSNLDLKSSDIIVDITGGTRTMGIGLTFGALNSAIDIQYVEQRSQKYEIIPLSITPEIILDKTGEYLMERYTELMEMKKREAQCLRQ